MGKREVEVPYKEGDVLAGKFRVEKVIGTGGMGVVLSCMHLALEQTVAVKLLLPDAAKKPDIRGRFAREARAAVKLQSEHVARVIDVGSLDDGSPFMVMEYLQGRDLGEIIDKDGAFDPQDAVDHVLQACEAVAEAHSLGIVHRDLKPSNLFLARRSDRTRTIKVLDFGISKVAGADDPVDASLTRTTDVLGSPMYMSPEQLRSSRTVDFKSDIWSLGVILFELLTLEPPFAGATLAEICGSILHEQPKKLSKVRAAMPAGLEAAILRCLEKAPSARFASVGDFADAIAPFGGEAAALSRSQIRRYAPLGALGSGDERDLVSTRAARAPLPEELAETRAAGASTISEAKATTTSWGERANGDTRSRQASKRSAGRSALPWILVALVLLGAGGAGAWQLGLVTPAQLGLGRADKPASNAAPAPADREPVLVPSPPSASPAATPTPSASAAPAVSAAASAAPSAAPSAVASATPSAKASATPSAVPASASASAKRATPAASSGKKPGKQPASKSDGTWEPTPGVPLEQPAEDPY